MPDDGSGQDENKFDIKVTLRAWDKQGKQFLKPKEDIDARKRTTKDDKVIFTLGGKGTMVNTGKPRVGSEITDPDGVVWIVDKLEGTAAPYSCYVTKKPIEKKP